MSNSETMTATPQPAPLEKVKEALECLIDECAGRVDLTEAREALALLTAYMASAASPAVPEGWSEALEDLKTHGSAWESAIIVVRSYADEYAPGFNDKAYWTHELKALQRVRQAISAMRAAPVVAVPEGWQKAFIESVVRSVSELPGRNSPEEAPWMMMVTSEELTAILEYHLAGAASPAVPEGSYRVGTTIYPTEEAAQADPMAEVVGVTTEDRAMRDTAPLPPSICEICHGSGYDERGRLTLQKQRCPNGCAVAGDDLVKVARLLFDYLGPDNAFDYPPDLLTSHYGKAARAVRDKIAADEREAIAAWHELEAVGLTINYNQAKAQGTSFSSRALERAEFHQKYARIIRQRGAK